MGADSWLELHTPQHFATNTAAPPMKLPADIPKRLDGCGRTFNAAMIVADACGQSEAAATIGAILDGLDKLPADVPRLFLEEDLRDILDALAKISACLAHAIDSQGRPHGQAGRSLLKNASVETDTDGFSYVTAGRLYLGDLRQRLALLHSFLDHAVTCGFLVEKEPA